jgi:ribonuclease HI
MNQVEIYTDGACSGNPGPGGWGVVLLYKGHRKELSGGEQNTTNQRMELTAAIKGLSSLKYPCQVKLYSDSAYLVNAFQQRWFDRWERNNWLTAKKTPVENQDLWRELLRLSTIHNIEWVKVKGHADNKENNRCDQLAREAINRV